MDKFDQQAYKNAFDREKYEVVKIRVPVGEREKIKEQAREKGYTSTNSYVLDLIKKDSKTF